jgi:hypothetical protein
MVRTMMKRWLRRVLRRYGVDVPYSQVICPEHVKTICVDADGGAKVTVRRSLVFLEVPERGDLCDTIRVEADCDVDHFIYDSPDAREIARRRVGPHTVVSYWEPREPVVRYGLYTHQHSWRPSGMHGQPAICTEFGCDTRTGVLALEVVTANSIETAVVFKRPRWRRMNTERRVVKYALTQLEAQEDRPTITHGGQRVEWRITEPKAGDSYICVVFHPYGVAEWQERLKATSLLGRLRHAIRPVIPA